MKRFVIICFVMVFCSFDCIADDNNAIGKIALEPYVTPELTGMPDASCNLLKNKLRQVIASSGLCGSLSERFVITANVDVLSKDITPTVPPMHAYELSVSMFVGDSQNGTLFSSSAVTCKGVGETETKAYNAALKAIKANSPELAIMVNIGKNKIIEYYNSIAPDLMNKALSLKGAAKYDEAIYVLSVIPNACYQYTAVEKMISEIYLAKIDHEAKPILLEAKALWSAKPSPENAELVMQILSKIDPDAPCFSEAETLMKTVEAVYIKELQRKRALAERDYQEKKRIEERNYQDAKAREQRNFDEEKSRYWKDFELIKAQQAHDFEMDPLRLKSAEKVAKVQARNQPKLDYTQVKQILRSVKGW